MPLLSHAELHRDVLTQEHRAIFAVPRKGVAGGGYGPVWTGGPESLGILFIHFSLKKTKHQGTDTLQYIDLADMSFCTSRPMKFSFHTFSLSSDYPDFRLRARRLSR